MPDPWETVLEDLETRVATRDASTWTPPVELGALPAALESRARAVLAAQQQVISEGRAELDRIGGELGALRRPSTLGSDPRSAFIDTLG